MKDMMTFAIALRAKADSLVADAKYLEYVIDTHSDGMEETYLDLLAVLEKDLFHEWEICRRLTATEQAVILSAPTASRDKWLSNLDDDQQAYILSQVSLPGGYP